MINRYLKHHKLPGYLWKILGERPKNSFEIHMLIDSNAVIRNYIVKEIVCAGRAYLRLF
jgi:hypothetical protein